MAWVGGIQFIFEPYFEEAGNNLIRASHYSVPDNVGPTSHLEILRHKLSVGRVVYYFSCCWYWVSEDFSLSQSSMQGKLLLPEIFRRMWRGYGDLVPNSCWLRMWPRQDFPLLRASYRDKLLVLNSFKWSVRFEWFVSLLLVGRKWPRQDSNLKPAH